MGDASMRRGNAKGSAMIKSAMPEKSSHGSNIGTLKVMLDVT